MPPAQFTPVLSLNQRLILVTLLVLSLAATSAVLFGPGRGARQDIGSVQDDLHVARGDINDTLGVSRRTLDELSAQLRTTKTSLEIQQQGLGVAQRSRRIAGNAAQDTAMIRRQTDETLSTIRQVITALGPLRQLKGDISTVAKSVEAGVVLARTTLDLGRQALRDGKRALDVAITTLATLKRSEQIQLDLLTVGRQTLAQVTEINRKIPLPGVFPTNAAAPIPTP